MRIIAGKYKSRKLKTLSSDQTRPTLDQVKESFFNRIGPYFDGGKVLDVFGGSGAISIEFLSRGVDCATIIESNRDAVNIIKENLEFVTETTKIYPMSFEKALKQIDSTFDYIYCDPPYHFKNIEKLFDLLKNVMSSESIVFYEADQKEDIHIPKGYQCLQINEYKRSKIIWIVLDQSLKDDDQ